MPEDYFDLHEIICEEERVKVRFLQDVPWTPLLAISDENMISSHNILRGTILQMPLWLARALHESGVAVVLPPRQFGTRVRADLAAEATAVNLRDLSRHWYSLGVKVGQILPSEGIARMLKGALAARLPLLGRALYSSSATPLEANPYKTVFGGTRSATSSPPSLDQWEEGIFAATLAARRDADAWSNRTSNVLKPHDLYHDAS